MIVFTVSGLWHGAAYTFIIWGALHGAIMVVERLIYGDKLKHLTDKFTLASLIRIAITFVIVNFAWIFFRIGNLGDVCTVLRKIFTEPGMPFVDASTLLMGFAAMALVFIYDLVKETNANIHLLSSRYMPVRILTASLLIIYLLGFGVLNGGSFIYFQF